MKNRTTICLIYLSTLPIMAFCQQLEPQPIRTPDASQLLEIQRGEVAYFKTLVYRFEVAWEEADVQSMADLRSGLMEIMKVEVKQMEDKVSPSSAAKERLQLGTDCLKKLENAQILAADTSLGKAAELNKTCFNNFIRLLEADFSEQMKAIRQDEKQ